jgi:TrmH family RNA methyltransferase
MLSRKQWQFIKSLQIKKYRQLHQSFIVEGAKSMQELLDSGFEVEHLLVTEPFLSGNESWLYALHAQPLLVSEAELNSLGSFENNHTCLAVVRMQTVPPLKAQLGEWVLVLDNIRDPGNLGTILRIADWYGISKLICSEETVDFYNPKVIAASMGSFVRVKAYYCDLPAYLGSLGQISLYGAVLQGANLHQVHLPPEGYLVLGNESNGISAELKNLLSHTLSIPRFGKAESLNVAIATAVICDHLRRPSRPD